MQNISIGVRLDNDLVDFVKLLKEERQLNSLLRSFLSVLKQDKARTIASLLTLEGTTSVSTLDAVNKAILFREYLNTDYNGSFKEYCAELDSVDIISLGLDLGVGVPKSEVQELVQVLGNAGYKPPTDSRVSSQKNQETDQNIEDIVLEILTRYGVIGGVEQKTTSYAPQPTLTRAVAEPVEEDEEDTIMPVRAVVTNEFSNKEDTSTSGDGEGTFGDYSSELSDLGL